jgi:hypothetical protein
VTSGCPAKAVVVAIEKTITNIASRFIILFSFVVFAGNDTRVLPEICFI